MNNEDEKDFFNYVLIVLGLSFVIMLTVCATIEYKKSNTTTETEKEIELCKLGKIVSIEEKEVTVPKTISVVRPGAFSPNHMPMPTLSTYQRTVAVPEYHVQLDNGITLVSRDEELPKNSIVGSYPKPEFCNEFTLSDNKNQKEENK